MRGLPQAPVRRDEYAVASTLRHSSVPTGSVAIPPAESGCSPIRAQSGLVPYPNPNLAVAWVRTLRLMPLNLRPLGTLGAVERVEW
jgi:hypothetical protein